MRSKKQYLKEIGIDIWQDKSKTKKAKGDTISGTNINAQNTQGAHGLDEVRKKVTVCSLCALHKTRTNAVFGVGNEKAQAMFIGEAPGANEDLQGSFCW